MYWSRAWFRVRQAVARGLRLALHAQAARALADADVAVERVAEQLAG